MPFCRSSIRQIKIKIKLVASFAFGYLVRGHTQLVNRSGCDSVIFVFIVTARAEESLAAFYDVFVLLLFGSFVAALTHCPRLSVALIFLVFFFFLFNSFISPRPNAHVCHFACRCQDLDV